MTGDQWVAVVTATFGGLVSLMVAFPAFWLAIRSANRPVVAAVEKIPVAITDAATKTVASIGANTEVLRVVEVQTNSNLTEAKSVADDLRSAALRLATETAEKKQMELLALQRELESARAEVVKLNALASPPLRTATQELREWPP